MFNKTSVSVLLLLLATHAAAQSTTDAITLPTEAQQLEADMYALFNKLNSTDEFDVACGERKVTGSTIPEWSCEAAFMKNAASRDMAGRWDNPNGAAANTQNGFIPQSGKEMSFKNRKKAQALNDEMMALARQNPELASLMIALNNKRKELAKAE